MTTAAMMTTAMTTVSNMRPLIFGEVLFDHFPDGSSVLGGAPFNVAWHLQAFGLKPLMVSRIGNDVLGRNVEEAMNFWGMDRSGLQKDKVHPTGTVQVEFNDGEPAYTIVDKVAYDFIDAAQLPELNGDWLLYHGSLALRHQNSVNALNILKKQRISCLFVDINLRAPWWHHDMIIELLKDADWLKLNKDELHDLFPDSMSDEIPDLISSSINEQVVLTGGERGATAISPLNESQISVNPEARTTVVDTVGAGDAFCSVLIAGRILGWPLETTMVRAQHFASAIVGIRGATPQQKEFYDQFTRDWGLRDSAYV